nr:Fic family protein [Collinsella tanakaei]
MVWAIAETIYDLHSSISKAGACFDPLSGASEEAKLSVIGRLASTVNTCFGVVFESRPDERYDGDVFLQVSKFCFMLAKDHVFLDGNKRTALIISLAILQRIKGIMVSVSDSSDPSENELYKWIQSIVAGDGDVDSLSAILRERARFGSY